MRVRWCFPGGIFSLIVLFGASAWIQLPAQASTKSVAGDESFVRMEYDSALSAYSVALQENPANAQVLWRMARVYVCLADISPEDGRMDLYRKAEEFARQSISADSAISEGHSWLAAALGNIAMDGSAKEKVRLCREIKQELDIAIALNPGDDLAYSILGSFYRALGNVSWIEKRLAGIFLGGLPSGGFEDAEQALQKAISLEPRVFRHHFELGCLYADWDRPQDAVVALKRATEVGPTVAADKRRIERAREMIAKLQDQG